MNGDATEDRYLSTGCGSLDELLGGGFKRGSVNQVYGPAASGKTNLALQTAVEAIEEGGSVVYVDNEGLSLERFKQIAGEKYEEVAKEFIVKEVYSFDEQVEAVKDVENLVSEVDLVVLDSATGLYRVEADADNGETALKRLSRQITHLASLARRYDVAVIVTNQVYTEVETIEESFRPLGGNVVEHWSNTITELVKQDQGLRKAVLEKHQSKPAGEEARFEIVDDGLASLP
ncbi:MAG: DNA repair and recombination protein RadB [Halobacteria archaeon]